MTSLALFGHGKWGAAIERTLKTFSNISLAVIENGGTAPDEIDGVLIATPSTTHSDIAFPFIERGIPTFIEKPMTTSVADALRLKDAAARSGALVFVGHVQLFNPAFVKVKEFLPEIGTIRSIECVGMNARPRKDSSVLWDWLPHDLSIARAVLGREADSVEAWNLSPSQFPEAAKSTFHFGDVPLTSNISWLSPQKRHSWTIAGTDGNIVLDDVAERKLMLSVHGEITYPECGSDLPLTKELEAFIVSIRTGALMGPGIDDGLAVVRAIAKAEESIEKGASLSLS